MHSTSWHLLPIGDCPASAGGQECSARSWSLCRWLGLGNAYRELTQKGYKDPWEILERTCRFQ